MIVVDGSALFAIMLDEPLAGRCADALEITDDLLISAGSLTEILIVAAVKGVLDPTRNFINALDARIMPLTEQRARDAAAAYPVWGKNFHEAKLNMGDCFAYALAKEFDCPLLFVGNDFALTDVVPALSDAPDRPSNP